MKETKTCVDCEYLKDMGVEWKCMIDGTITPSPENYNAEQCEYYVERRDK